MKRFPVRYCINSEGYIRKQFSDGHVEFVDKAFLQLKERGRNAVNNGLTWPLLDDSLENDIYVEIPKYMAIAAGAIK